MTAPITDSMAQRIVSRPMQDDEDWRRVHRLLIDTYPLTPVDWNWEIRRWEGFRYHDEDISWKPQWSARYRLWETEDGQLVGAAHPEGDGNAFLELHPDYRHIEEDMIAWCEDHLTTPTEDGQQRRLDFFVNDYDAPRLRLLDRRGYKQQPWSGVTRRLRFGNKQLPPVVLAEGYVMRTVRPGDMNDCHQIAALLNAAFDRTFHRGEDFLSFATHAPSFRYDLHLVAEAPDGTFAAHVGITYEPENCYGVFEPVMTHPDHRRKGLAQTLMFEGLHRLKALGAADVYVGTGDAVAANRLYESIGFTEAYKGFVWRKVW